MPSVSVQQEIRSASTREVSGQGSKKPSQKEQSGDSAIVAGVTEREVPQSKGTVGAPAVASGAASAATASVAVLPAQPAVMSQVGRIVTALLATAQWVFLSVTLILFNKWLMQYGGFPLPLTLCTMHMATSFAIACIFKLFGQVETNLTVDQIVRLVLPTGLLFASAICTGNEAFLYLTVSFIQMVKAWTPTVVLILSVLAGLEHLSCRLVAIVLITSGGVALAIYGELEFAMFGFVMILGSVVLEALRLVLVEVLYSSSEVRLSGLSGVFYMSPICFLAVLPVAFVFEGDKIRSVFESSAVRPHLLAINCCCAFLLNVSSLVLVKHTSALTLKVCRARACK